MLDDLARLDGAGFGTVCADPPWPYDNRVRGDEAFPRQMISDGSRRRRSVSEWTYEPLSLDDIKALPVSQCASKNAHLYLWTTNSFMEEAYQVVRAACRVDRPRRPSSRSR